MAAHDRCFGHCVEHVRAFHGVVERLAKDGDPNPEPESDEQRQREVELCSRRDRSSGDCRGMGHAERDDRDVAARPVQT